MRRPMGPSAPGPCVNVIVGTAWSTSKHVVQVSSSASSCNAQEFGNENHRNMICVDGASLVAAVEERLLPVSSADYYLTYCGERVLGGSALRIQFKENGGMPSIDLEARARLLGGKGGFGSLLRALGAKQATVRTTNFDACRDLHGRRLRNVQDEEALEKWESTRKRLLKEAEEKKQAKLVKAAQAKKHHFADEDYGNAVREGIEKTEAAVTAALKRKPAGGETAKPQQQRRKKRRMLGDSSEESSDSDGASAETETDEAVPAPSVSVAEAEEVDDAEEIAAPVESPILQQEQDKEKNGDEKAGDSTDKAAGHVIDLSLYDTVDALVEGESAESIKFSLTQLGLKCGGLPADRAARLFGTKGMDPDDFPAKWRRKKK